MFELSMGVDLDSCVGCFACQNACKMVNNLDYDVKWLRVLPEYCQPEEVHGRLCMDRFPIPATLSACIECPDRADGAVPLCAKVCMGRALLIDKPEKVASWVEGKRSVVFNI